jgi:branched-chain amino acid aminotransferase
MGLDDSVVFFDGEFRPYGSVRLGLLTHALNYGTGCLGGMRAYWSQSEQRLRLVQPIAHFERLRASAGILGLSLPHSPEELRDIAIELLRRNRCREDVYLRPLLFVSEETLPCYTAGLRTSLSLCAVPFGSYVALDRGLRAVVSTWRRVPDVALPARAKIAGTYVNATLAKDEAIAAGVDEAITLTMGGKVSEGSAENVFIRRGGVFSTPSVTCDILEGITRRLVMTLIREELRMDVIEREIDRSELYCSDEIVLCGTGAQVASVVEIDHRPIGGGSVGACAKRLQELYFGAVRGEVPRYLDWSVPV